MEAGVNRNPGNCCTALEGLHHLLVMSIYAGLLPVSAKIEKGNSIHA